MLETQTFMLARIFLHCQSYPSSYHRFNESLYLQCASVVKGCGLISFVNLASPIQLCIEMTKTKHNLLYTHTHKKTKHNLLYTHTHTHIRKQTTCYMNTHTHIYNT